MLEPWNREPATEPGGGRGHGLLDQEGYWGGEQRQGVKSPSPESGHGQEEVGWSSLGRPLGEGARVPKPRLLSRGMDG